MAGRSPHPPEAKPPALPRTPARLVPELDPDIDPEFPDVVEAELVQVELSFPSARTLTVVRSKLTGCSIAGDTDAALDAADTVFVDLDLTGRSIESLCRVVFVGCRLGGADLGDARLNDVHFDGCVLDLASMRSARLERVLIDGGRVDGLDLSSARLSDVVFDDVSLGEVTLDAARLDRVDLTGADLSGVADISSIRGATIGETQAVALAARLARAAGIQIHRSS